MKSITDQMKDIKEKSLELQQRSDPQDPIANYFIIQNNAKLHILEQQLKNWELQWPRERGISLHAPLFIYIYQNLK